MRYCGVDVSAKPGNQQLVTLHERRAPAGGVELVATFYTPGTTERLARTIEGFGRGATPAAPPAAPRPPPGRGPGPPGGRNGARPLRRRVVFRARPPFFPLP